MFDNEDKERPALLAIELVGVGDGFQFIKDMAKRRWPNANIRIVTALFRETDDGIVIGCRAMIDDKQERIILTWRGPFAVLGKGTGNWIEITYDEEGEEFWRLRDDQQPTSEPDFIDPNQ